MTELDKIISRIRAPILTGKMSKRELARRAGVRDTTLIGMEAVDWDPNRRTLEALLRAINAKQVNQRINSRNPRRRHVTTPARHSGAGDAEALGNGAARLPVVVHRLPQRLAPGAFTHAVMVRQRGAGVNAFHRKG